MSADPLMTRMSVLARALPTRILVVDDDELELELMADRLATAGFEVTTAANGGQALAILERQWFPLLITDWEMPVMDGIELTERLRGRGVDDTFVIMLTVRDAGLDYERGYHAGVDDYLTKKMPDAELLARVQKGFSTLTMRRSLKEARAALESRGNVDVESGAFTTEHLLATLRSECKRAERYNRNLSVMTLGVGMRGEGDHDDAPTSAVAPDTLRRIVDTLRTVVRSHVDWIARVDSPNEEAVFAIVLPEAAAVDAVSIKDRFQGALRALTEVLRAEASSSPRLQFSFGFAALDRGRTERKPTEALDLVSVAENCRGCLRSRGQTQLTAVQGSVTHGVAICCRHGYAVDSHCHFMGESRSPIPHAIAAE
jgi:two-component system, cell cycle response regulator